MRKCTVCQVEMVEGYLNEETGNTFCTGEHLNEFYKEDIETELNNMDDDELEESVIYWTSWEDEEEE